MVKRGQVKYKKAPQAPRRFKSSYMFFSTEKHKQIRKELTEKGEMDKMATTEVAKMVSQAWKNLSSQEREEWEEKARRDKARYEVEKTMYTGPWKVPAKKRSQKDPNAPKRPMSAFLSFSNSKRGHVKAEHPEIGNAEVSRILAKMWKEAPEDERKEHIDKEFKLRQKYKTAIAAWRKNTEDEMQAARKEREDEALKTAMSAKNPEEGEFPPRMAGPPNGEYGGQHPYHHPPPGPHMGMMNGGSHAYGGSMHSMVPPAYTSHYGYSPYDETGPGPPMESSAYAPPPFYGNGPPPSDGYSQHYAQSYAHANAYGGPPPVDPGAPNYHGAGSYPQDGYAQSYYSNDGPPPESGGPPHYSYGSY